MSELSFAYYPGCSGSGTSLEYDRSTRAVCAALDIKLNDVSDWNCCGSTPAHMVDHYLSTALASRNLSQAEKDGFDHVLTPCPSCLKNLHNAIEHLAEPGFSEKVEALTQKPAPKTSKASSVLQIIYEQITPEGLAAKVKKPLKGLKLVPYYGCLMTRPGRSMHFDSEENPISIDRLLEAAGAEVLPFPLKAECCGASFGIPRSDVVARLSGRILSLASSLGADAVVVACPLCQMNLDLRQGQVNSALHSNIKLPVFYFTQLLGVALGADPKQMAFDKLVVNPKPVLDKIGRDAKEAKATEEVKA